MKYFIYILVLFSFSLTSCITSKQSAQRKSEKEAKELIKYAKQYTNAPYSYGGASPKGFDCSGYVQFVYKKFGYTLPRTSQNQAKVGIKVDKKKLKTGDLVFFKGKNNKSKKVGHVGIVVDASNGKFDFIHASSSGVKIDNSELKYYKSRYVNARRIIMYQ